MLRRSGRRRWKKVYLRSFLWRIFISLVPLTDNCQPIRPAGSDPAGTLTLQEQTGKVLGQSSIPLERGRAHFAKTHRSSIPLERGRAHFAKTHPSPCRQSSNVAIFSRWMIFAGPAPACCPIYKAQDLRVSLRESTHGAG